MKKIELLAPAGNLDCLKVAVDNGADAVYIGGQMFSARAFANNFTNEEIIDGINYAHIRGCKVYVSINTLIYDEELEDLIAFTDFLYLNNVDALIVADFGLINKLKERYPNLPIHVSTQLNTHTLWQIKLLETINVQRVILARETPIETIKNITDNSSLEIEVFAHGALCICYSGNCLHSSMVGKRSGNRGKCAQPCRMEYTLLENNKPVSNKKFLLSTKDLNVLEHIDEIINANVTSLKIEGRMKNVEYVAFIVNTYREAIDRYYENLRNIVDHEAIEKSKLIFSRMYTKGFILNEDNYSFTNTYRPSHIGIKVGKVIAIKDGKVSIKLINNLSQKDKIAIIQDKLDDIGMFVSKIFVKNKLVARAFKNEIVELSINSKVQKDATIYKVIDNELQNEIKENYLNKVKKIPIKMKFISNVGEKMALIVKDDDGNSFLMKSNYIVEEAINSPTLSNRIQEQLSKLNDTAYGIKEISVYTDEKGVIPIKFINELRREAVEKLNQLRIDKYNRTKDDINPIVDYIDNIKPQRLKLKIKVNSLEQLQAIKDLKGIDSIYYNELKTYKIAKGKYPSLNLIPVLKRVYIEDSIEVKANAYVINNYGDLLKYENNRLITDLYMNVANKYTISSLMKYGVESITLSSELNRNQIKTLIDDMVNEYGVIPPLEMVVYGRYQTMILNHCFISKELGMQRKHCGKCLNKKFALLDRMNYVFPVQTDENCTLTIYNSKKLNLIDYVDEIITMGISSIRLDFSFETPEEVLNITQAFIDIIDYKNVALSINDSTYGYYLDNEKN